MRFLAVAALLFAASIADAGSPKTAGKRSVTLLDRRALEVEHPIRKIVRHPSLPFVVVLMDEDGDAAPITTSFVGPAALVDLKTGTQHALSFDFNTHPDRLWGPDGTWLDVGGDTFKGLSLVHRDNLGAFAAGDDSVVRKVVLEEDKRTAKLHSIARWLGPDSLVLGAACCDCVIYQQVDLAPGGKATDYGMSCGREPRLACGTSFAAPNTLVFTKNEREIPVSAPVQTVHGYEDHPRFLLLQYSSPDGDDRALIVDPKSCRNRDLGVVPEEGKRTSPDGTWFAFARDPKRGVDVIVYDKLLKFLAGDDTVVRALDVPPVPPGTEVRRWDVVRWVSKDELEIMLFARPHHLRFRANAVTGKVVPVEQK